MEWTMEAKRGSSEKSQESVITRQAGEDGCLDALSGGGWREADGITDERQTPGTFKSTDPETMRASSQCRKPDGACPPPPSTE